GVLFTFPSRYLSAIGHQVVFRLSKWSCQIHTGFHGPGATREHDHTTHAAVRLQGSHPLRQAFPDLSAPTTLHSAPRGSKGSIMPHNPARTTPAGCHARTV